MVSWTGNAARPAQLPTAYPMAVATGKGGRRCACPFGKRAARDLDRYPRIRARHRDVDRPELWPGNAGPLSDSSNYQVLRRRARQAGIGPI